jgi:hypothetical protein
MMAEPTNRTISILRGTGPRATKATLYEDAPGLAVHRGDDDTYTITHLRSGTRILGGFPTQLRAYEAAVALCRTGTGEALDWSLPGDVIRDPVHIGRYHLRRQQVMLSHGGGLTGNVANGPLSDLYETGNKPL